MPSSITSSLASGRLLLPVCWSSSSSTVQKDKDQELWCIDKRVNETEWFYAYYRSTYLLQLGSDTNEHTLSLSLCKYVIFPWCHMINLTRCELIATFTAPIPKYKTIMNSEFYIPTYNLFDSTGIISGRESANRVSFPVPLIRLERANSFLHRNNFLP